MPRLGTTARKLARVTEEDVTDLLALHESSSRPRRQPPTATWSELLAWLTKSLKDSTKGNVLHLAVLNLHRTLALWSKKSLTDAFPIAAACLWTASKYHQGPNCFFPEEVIRMMPRQHRVDEAALVHAEQEVCTALNFKLQGHTVHTFFHLFSDLLGDITDTESWAKASKAPLDRTLSLDFTKTPEPLLAAGVLYATNRELGIRPLWPPSLKKCTRFSAKEVEAVANAIVGGGENCSLEPSTLPNSKGRLMRKRGQEDATDGEGHNALVVGQTVWYPELRRRGDGEEGANASFLKGTVEKIGMKWVTVRAVEDEGMKGKKTRAAGRTVIEAPKTKSVLCAPSVLRSDPPLPTRRLHS